MGYLVVQFGQTVLQLPICDKELGGVVAREKGWLIDEAFLESVVGLCLAVG